jgi:hypothetical protein
MVKAFDEAAFRRSRDSSRPSSRTEYGFHILQVLEARPAGDDIVRRGQGLPPRRLELERASEVAVTEAKRIRGKVTKASDIARVAAEEGLKVEEVLYSSADRLLNLGPSPAFATAVAGLTAGQVTDAGRHRARHGDRRLHRRPPARPAPLDEVRNDVKTDVLNERARQSALETARRIAAAGSLADGAKAAKLEVKSSATCGPGFNLSGVGAVPISRRACSPRARPSAPRVRRCRARAPSPTSSRGHEAFDPSRFAADKSGLKDQVLEQRRNEMLRGISTRCAPSTPSRSTSP